MGTLTNLDIECAELGRKLASLDIKEKGLNDALTVLEEQGLYAMFFYIQAKYESNVKNDFQRYCTEFLKHILSKNKQANDEEVKGVLEFIKELAKNLDELLFAWDLLRRALSYALCYLKVKES